jgi:rhamnosyltransferase
MAPHSISIVVPTLNGGADFARLCHHLGQLRDSCGVEVLVIDSGSGDRTIEHAETAGLRVHSIPPSEFGHGRTRNLGVQLTEGDVVCFLTQDVLPCTPDWPLRFAAMLAEPGVAGVYGRQVPRDATAMEMFFVALNYPGEPLRFEPQPGGHHPRPGRVLFSNAFSAVRRDVILRVPFAADVPVSEDQVWAHQVLADGYSIAYEPAAEALHAHSYSMRGLFGRTYRVGRALRMIGLDGGASPAESVRFLGNEVRYFLRQGHSHRLPQLLAYEFVRWAGFQAGRRHGDRPEQRRADGASTRVVADTFGRSGGGTRTLP